MASSSMLGLVFTLVFADAAKCCIVRRKKMPSSVAEEQQEDDALGKGEEKQDGEEELMPLLELNYSDETLNAARDRDEHVPHTQFRDVYDMEADDTAHIIIRADGDGGDVVVSEENDDSDVPIVYPGREGDVQTSRKAERRREPLYRIVLRNPGTILFFSTILLVRAMSNLFSTKYAPAGWVQMINLSTPVFVVFLSCILREANVPLSIVPTIIASSFGSYLVIASRSWKNNNGDDDAGGGEVTAEEILGIGLAMLSCFSLAAYMQCVRLTKSIINEKQLTILSMIVLFMPNAILSTLTEGSWIDTYRNLTVWHWIGFFTFAATYTISTILQQCGIRKIGSALYSAFTPFRLLSSVVFAAIILNENDRNIVAYLGYAMVAASMACFLISRLSSESRAPAPSIALESGPEDDAAVVLVTIQDGGADDSEADDDDDGESNADVA